MEWFIGGIVLFYVFLCIYNTFSYRFDSGDDCGFFIIFGLLPLFNILPITLIPEEDGCFRSHSDTFNRMFKKFGYQGLDDESIQQLKDAKEARNTAIEAAKTEYATLAIGIKKKAKKRSILDKLELTEKDLDELKEILSERQ